MATPSARRRTRSPSTLTTSTVARSAFLMEIEMLLASFLPSPLGEKKSVIRPTVMTGGELLSRCATKKAAKVEPTSTRNVTLATSVIARMRLLTLVGANDDDGVPGFLQVAREARHRGLRIGGELADLVDPQRVGDG